MTISEFLLARLAEDEVRTVSYKLKRGAPGMSIGDPRIPEGHVAIGETIRGMVTMPRSEYYAKHCDPVTDERKTTTVAAHRAIVQHCEELQGRLDDHDAWDVHGVDHILRALASVYADHPDYDEAWRSA